MDRLQRSSLLHYKEHLSFLVISMVGSLQLKQNEFQISTLAVPLLTIHLAAGRAQQETVRCLPV